jgi:hypothetical protein
MILYVFKALYETLGVPHKVTQMFIRRKFIFENQVALFKLL